MYTTWVITLRTVLGATNHSVFNKSQSRSRIEALTKTHRHNYTGISRSIFLQGCVTQSVLQDVVFTI